VSNLLTQLLGARIEKRREVITSIVTAIDTNRPVGRASMTDIPMPYDPLNFTLTGHSESGLGIAARLEDHTTAAIPISSRPPPPNAQDSLWRWVGAFGLLVTLVAIGGYYIFVMRPKQAEAAAIQQLAEAGTVADAAVATVASGNTPASGSAKRSDKALSVDSLPVDTQSGNEPVIANVGRVKKGKKGDKSAVEGANEGSSDSDQKGAANDKPTEGSAADMPVTPLGIDRSAANAALATAAAGARACRTQGQAPSPTGRAAVTFSPDGSVTAVSISQNFMGTPIGNCVIAHYRAARAPSFVGDATTLFSSFNMLE
jgi:hypothetical protein